MRSNTKVIGALVVATFVGVAGFICWSQEGGCNGQSGCLEGGQDACSPLNCKCSYFTESACFVCQAANPINDCYANTTYQVTVTIYTNGICSYVPPNLDLYCVSGKVVTNYPTTCLDILAHPGCEP
jgi:hypothetical protein